MKNIYKLVIALSVMVMPFVTQSQENPIDDFDWGIYEEGLLPDADLFLSMTSDGDGAVADPIPVQPCPSTERRTHKVKVTVSGQNKTEAKKKLRAYKAKHDTSKAMNDLLKTKFSCAECELPDVTPCTLSVSNVNISFSDPKKIRDGVYSSTLTIRYDANCDGCEIQVDLRSGKAIKNQVTVFPNPVREAVRVNVKLKDPKEKVRFRILDSTGRLVKAVSVIPPGLEVQKDIEINDLQSGIYYLESTQGEHFKDVTQFIKIE